MIAGTRKRLHGIMEGNEVLEACPFSHQVGGHSAVVTLRDSHLVAKPLDKKKREMSFYEKAPKALRSFVPTFHGVGRVSFSPDAVKDSSEDSDDSDDREDNEFSVVPAPTAKKAGHSAAVEEPIPPYVGSNRVGSPFQSPSMTSGKVVNPWSLTMYQKQIDKSRASPDNGDSEATIACILLENLTRKFNKPCVLDLKIGTRSYADDASPQKRAKHIEKVSSTTSSSLGFRVCGMQVYNRKSQRYFYQDKYHGRSLTPETVPAALESFFTLNTGNKPRSSAYVASVVRSFLKKLKELEAIIADQKGLRFYSSSLLLLYDGAWKSDSGVPIVDVRVIDFAGATFYSLDSAVRDAGAICASPDEGFLLGLRNLQKYFRAMIE
eukprot:m.114006 g.114006  ORF g.114006 m.114006 type:complete len:379 (-) comp17114_c0_seq1:161-1297(-)